MIAGIDYFSVCGSEEYAEISAAAAYQLGRVLIPRFVFLQRPPLYCSAFSGKLRNVIIRLNGERLFFAVYRSFKKFSKRISVLLFGFFLLGKNLFFYLRRCLNLFPGRIVDRLFHRCRLLRLRLLFWSGIPHPQH